MNICTQWLWISCRVPHLVFIVAMWIRRIICHWSKGIGQPLSAPQWQQLPNHRRINQVYPGFSIAAVRGKYGSREAGSPYAQDWSKRAIAPETSSDVAR